MFKPLEDALIGQYESFRAARPQVVQGCPCCTSPAELDALIAAPREALGPEQLEFYAFKAMTTVGTTDDFRYYWPRLSELSVRDQLITDAEIVFGKPLYAAHHAWPVEERQAILRLAAALGERFAFEEIEAGDVDSWVCVIGLLSEQLADPRRFLEPLLSGTPAAQANRGSFLDWNREPVRTKGRLSNAFWDNAPESAQRVLEWLSRA